jgi:hypothetical protein
MLYKTKKTGILLLLLIVAAPVLLFTGFLIKQKSIQYNMNERLQKASLHTITANLADVKWIKQNKEAEINGRLVDVKEYYITRNQIIITGLYDDEEHELKKDMVELIKEKKGSPAPIHQLVLKLILSVTIDEHDVFSLTFLSTADKIKYPINNESTISQYLSVITPPPNI